MRHDLNFHASPRGHYRPARAWLGQPGAGPVIRERRSSGLRRRIGRRELRILGIALVLGVVAWGQMIGSLTQPAPEQSIPSATAEGDRTS